MRLQHVRIASVKKWAKLGVIVVAFSATMIWVRPNMKMPPAQPPQMLDSRPATARFRTLNFDVRTQAILQQQEIRHKVLAERCSGRPLLQTVTHKSEIRSLLERTIFLYSDKHKMIVCTIPSCGTSSIKKIFLAAEGVVDEKRPEKIDPRIVHKTADGMFSLNMIKDTEELFKRYDSYYKVMIVREPMVRLVSAYRSKLEVSKDWNKFFVNQSRMIHSRYSSDPDGLASFSEFLTFLLQTRKALDRHWDLYNNLCAPCSIDYDFIAHLETIDDDMHYVINKVGMQNMTFPHNYEKARQTGAAKALSYYERVSPELARKIYDKYKTDYELFGYSEPWEILRSEMKEDLELYLAV